MSAFKFKAMLSNFWMSRVPRKIPRPCHTFLCELSFCHTFRLCSDKWNLPMVITSCTSAFLRFWVSLLDLSWYDSLIDLNISLSALTMSLPADLSKMLFTIRDRLSLFLSIWKKGISHIFHEQNPFFFTIGFFHIFHELWSLGLNGIFKSRSSGSLCFSLSFFVLLLMPTLYLQMINFM